MEAAAIYDHLAGLVQYPDEHYAEHVARCGQVLGEAEPAAASLLQEFSRRLANLTIEALQELYTQTFDLNPACSLEVGWHLFGENYGRGEFLVKMRRELHGHGLEESSELPDHLTHALALLGRLPGADADKLAALVLTALEKMRAALKGPDNPFEYLLEAIACLLGSRHGNLQAENSPDVPVLRVWEARGLKS